MSLFANCRVAALIDGFMGTSANFLTTVLLGSHESLSASVDGSAKSRLSNPGGQRDDYTLSLIYDAH